MTNFINKSNHPVQIKRILVRIWTLRDEIESGIAKRIHSCNEAGEEVDVEDIKLYYQKYLNPELNQKEDTSEAQEPENDENLDASGNPMDDDANAMMAAMSGGDEKEEDSAADEQSTNEPPEGDDEAAKMAAEMLADQGIEVQPGKEEQEEPQDSEQSNEDSEQDDEAAKMAAQMLADQGIETEEKQEPSDEDDEADKLAAQMLADQGMGPKPETTEEEDDEAAKLASQMLEDQGINPKGSDEEEDEDTKSEQDEKPKKEWPPFQRVLPSNDKIANGYVLLSDVQMDQMLIFCDKTFMLGQNVIIEFLVTQKFSISAELLVSQNIGRNSKIIKEISYLYRLQCKTLFQFPLERSNLREFLKAIEPDVPVPPKKLKKPDDEDDDDFDDLGF